MNEATLKEARILMVDDDVNSRCLMTNFLNRIGYSAIAGAWFAFLAIPTP
jgi:CheY-like chemotaxis protein